MPQSLAAVYLHVVFSTKAREPWIADAWADRLYGYVGGVANGNGLRLLAAGGMPDHVHLLVSLGRQHTIADTVGRLKASSSRWVHDTFADLGGFAWQAGYGAFSVSQSQVPVITNYVHTQAEHHRGRSFQDEYREMLARHGIEYDERYVWD